MKDIPEVSAAANDVDRLLPWAELCQIIPYSRVQVWRLEREGNFPARIAIGQNRVAWSLLEIQAWIQARKAARGSPTNVILDQAAARYRRERS